MSGLSKKIAGIWLLFLVIVCGLGPLLLELDPYQPIGPPITPPGEYSLLGTDSLGRDETARMIYGGRTTLSISLMAFILTLLLGGITGFIAALYRGWTNTLVQSSSDILMAVPGLLLAMLLVAALGPGMFTVMIAVGIGTMPIFTRLSRSVVSEILASDYILASYALGANRLWVTRQHLLRNGIKHLVPIITNLFAWIMLSITTLTFIGLGGDPSIAEWGTMLNASRVHLVEAPWLALWPALAISITILSVHSLGRGLTEAGLPSGASWNGRSSKHTVDKLSS